MGTSLGNLICDAMDRELADDPDVIEADLVRDEFYGNEVRVGLNDFTLTITMEQARALEFQLYCARMLDETLR